MSVKTGTLYVVATPIGNLTDITQRAISTLQGVDAILAEDTRHSKLLLRAIGIENPLFALHAHNEMRSVSKWMTRLQQGESLAIISDAGTPLISDPGHMLVKSAHQAGITVVPIPGSCAVITALCASGLSAHRFVFEGFLPAKSGERKNHLKTLCEETRTVIFYEAPHRLLASLNDMRAIFGGDRPATLARELTKQFETIHLGTLETVYTFCSADINQQKGEMVILIAGKPKAEIAEAALSDATLKVLTVLLADLPVNQAVRLTAQITGEKKNRLYAHCLKKSGM